MLVNKTKMQVIVRVYEINFIMFDYILKQVKWYKYLGSMIKTMVKTWTLEKNEENL